MPPSRFQKITGEPGQSSKAHFIVNVVCHGGLESSAGSLSMYGESIVDIGLEKAIIQNA